MQISVKASSLRDALIKVSAAIPSRTALPALASAAMTAADGQLSLTTNNLDFGLCVRVPCEIEKAGSVAVTCNRLKALAESLNPDMNALLTADERFFLALTQGARFAKLAGHDISECPPLPAPEKESATLRFEKGELKSLIATLSPFICDDDTRYVLCGILFISEKGKCTAFATNGRMARIVETTQAFTGTSVLPKAALRAIRSAVDDLPCVITFSESSAVITGEGFLFATKLIEGNPPNVRQVVPSDRELVRHISFDRDPMLDELLFAALAAQNASGGYVTVKLTATKAELQLSSLNLNSEASKTIVAGARGDGEVSIAFQEHLLRALIASFPEQEQRLLISNEINPAVIKNATGVGVLSPMRIS